MQSGKIMNGKCMKILGNGVLVANIVIKVGVIKNSINQEYI